MTEIDRGKLLYVVVVSGTAPINLSFEFPNYHIIEAYSHEGHYKD
jgi:hypothetical protein